MQRTQSCGRLDFTGSGAEAPLVSQGVQTEACSPYTGSLWVLVLPFGMWPFPIHPMQSRTEYRADILLRGFFIALVTVAPKWFKIFYDFTYITT